MSLKIVISRVIAGLTTRLCVVNKSLWHVVNNWLGVRLCEAVKGLREKTHTESLCQELCCPLTAGQPSIPGCPPPLITAMTSQRDPDTVSISGQISLYILHHCTISTWWASGVILECVQIFTEICKFLSSIFTLLLHRTDYIFIILSVKCNKSYLAQCSCCSFPCYESAWWPWLSSYKTGETMIL